MTTLPDSVLKDWRSLNHVLSTLTEDQVKLALDTEIVEQRRVTFLVRLHQRYTILRADRERIAILKEGMVP